MSEPRILRLRGLPWSVGEPEVRRFLHLPDSQDVFIRRRGELSTGEAYVEMGSFEEASDVQNAYNREMLGGRYIEIFLADASSMAELQQKIREQDKGWVVRLRGLPFKATQEDVLAFFRGIEVLNGLDGITLIYGRDGRPMGEAYVELHDEESQTRALHLDRERMGTRYIEVFKSTKADLNVRLQSARKNEGLRRHSWTGTGALDSQLGLPNTGTGVVMVPYAALPSQMGATSSTLRLTGLINDTNEYEIAQYFSEFGVMPGSVQLLVDNSRGYISGRTALVAFASPAYAEAARQQCQHRLFKDQHIEAFLSLEQPAGPSTMGPYQQPGLPMNMSGMWAYPPTVGYMYDDLSKLIRPNSPAHQAPTQVPRAGIPVPNLLGPYMPSAVMPGQTPFGGPLMQQSGSPSYAPRQTPASPSQPVPYLGQGRAYSPAPMPVMRPASPVGMNQQQMLLQQHQLYLLHQQQQQQYLSYQASRYNPAPWIGPQHQKGGSQYSIPRPNQSYPSRAIGGPRATGTPSAGPSLSHTIPQAPSITQQAMTAGPSLLGESGLQAGLSLQQNSDILSMQHSSQMSLHPSSHDSSTLPPLSTMRSTSQRLPSIPVQGRQILPGHDAFAHGSSGDLSQRHSSDPVLQNLSIASLHLSDRAPSGRSHATSTTASGRSGPSGEPWVGANVRGTSQNLGSQNLGSQNLGSQNLGSQTLGSQNLGSQNLGSQHLPDVQY